MIVLDEVHLRRILGRYFKYYNATHCHLSLACDAPEPRASQGPELSRVTEFPEVADSTIDTSGPQHDEGPGGWTSAEGETGPDGVLGKDNVADGVRQLVERAHARGVKVIGTTMGEIRPAAVGKLPTEPDRAHIKCQEAYPETLSYCDPR